MKERKVKHLGQICKGPNVSKNEINELKDTLFQIKDIERVQSVLKGIAGSTRLKILILLHQTDQLCVCDISDILNTTVSAVSHQLGRLKKLGLVETRRDAQTIFYSLTEKKKIHSILEVLDLL